MASSKQIVTKNLISIRIGYQVNQMRLTITYLSSQCCTPHSPRVQWVKMPVWFVLLLSGSSWQWTLSPSMGVWMLSQKLCTSKASPCSWWSWRTMRAMSRSTSSSRSVLLFMIQQCCSWIRHGPPLALCQSCEVSVANSTYKTSFCLASFTVDDSHVIMTPVGWTSLIFLID